jgi:hypothetical protein
MKTLPNRIKVKLATQGYIIAGVDVIYSLTDERFYAPYRYTKLLWDWGIYLIQEGTTVNAGGWVFMRGIHKFQLEATLAFEFTVGLQDINRNSEKFAFKDLTVLDEWEVKFSMEGPVANKTTFYDSPYLSDFLRFHGGWSFLGYKRAIATFNKSNHSKPTNALKTPNDNAIADVFCRPLGLLFDNFSVTLKCFDYKRSDWVDYPVNLTEEHSVTVEADKRPPTPNINESTITVNEGKVVGAFDEFVYDVVERSVDGITLAVRRRNWLSLLNDGDIMQTRAPWYSIVRAFNIPPEWNLYRGFGYRHYPFPIVDLALHEKNDFGQDLYWEDRLGEFGWASEGFPVPLTRVYARKRLSDGQFLIRPRHIRSFTIVASQLALSVDVKPSAAW